MTRIYDNTSRLRQKGCHSPNDILNAFSWNKIYEFRSLFQWRHNKRNGVSNHRRLQCLLNRLFRRRWKKTSKLSVTVLCGGIHGWPVYSPHKKPVTQKMFSFDEVITKITEMIHTEPLTISKRTKTMWRRIVPPCNNVDVNNIQHIPRICRGLALFLVAIMEFLMHSPHVFTRVFKIALLTLEQSHDWLT